MTRPGYISEEKLDVENLRLTGATILENDGGFLLELAFDAEDGHPIYAEGEAVVIDVWPNEDGRLIHQVNP